MRAFGLIGYPLGHSFSKKYFTEKFEREGITGNIYELYPLEHIDQLENLLVANPDLAGLNVTIPYKEQVIAYLDKMSPVVEEIGACNCILIEEGQLIGHNTDVIGFSRSLMPKLKPHHKQALILGTGGSAKAVAYTLKDLGIPFLQVSRTPMEGMIGYEDIDQSMLETHTLLINTTPVGMYPHVEMAPAIPYDFIGADHYLFDLVYNPARTRFLQEGVLRGAAIENGSDMLVIQAEASWEIWNS
jgi:shikimate dehydrogenase